MLLFKLLCSNPSQRMLLLIDHLNKQYKIDLKQLNGANIIDHRDRHIYRFPLISPFRIYNIAPIKVIIPRSFTLLSSIEVFRLYGSLNRTFKFEFENEAGTGKGLTEETFSIISQQLQTNKLKLWLGTIFPSSKHTKSLLDQNISNQQYNNNNDIFPIIIQRCNYCNYLNIPTCNKHTSCYQLSNENFTCKFYQYFNDNNNNNIKMITRSDTKKRKIIIENNRQNFINKHNKFKNIKLDYNHLKKKLKIFMSYI